MPNILMVTWLQDAPFRENVYDAHSAFQTRSYVPNLKSLAQAVLKMRSIVCQKIRDYVTWATPLLGKVIYASGRISHGVPNLKSPALIDLNIFLIVCQKIYGSRDLKPHPFREKLFVRLLGFSKFFIHQISFGEQLMVTWRRRRTFRENYSESSSAFPRRNLKSLAQVVL